jgi:signal transduction histidine kinase
MSFRENHTSAGTNRTGDFSRQSSSDGSTNADLQMALELAQKKLQIVGSITRHDVLNQLTAIVGYNELLSTMVEDPQLRSYLEKEKQATDKIRRLFQFAKDYQNLGVEPPRWQNVNNIVHRASEEVDLKNIRVTAETGNASVYADPLFEKVLTHLFDNTIRHGKTASEIRITLRKDGPGAVLTVEDNGAGVPTEEKMRIFERGYGKSTGWGLFLVREILKITGMMIEENGEPGKGARFEITLPGGTIRMSGGEFPVTGSS